MKIEKEEKNSKIAEENNSDSETDLTSRRRFVGTVTTGIIGALASNALAQQSGNTTNSQQTSSQTAKQNPLDQYPKPPFPVQQQEWPGLASKMTPRPDHGETSYKGSGRLTGRKALITGGDSGMGRAAAIAFAREGADVAINYLPAEEADAREVIELIRSSGRKAVAIPGDIRDEKFCQQLVAEAVRQLGGLDILVNNAARQQSVDSIMNLTTEQFDWTFKTNVYAMFWITKAAMPNLQPGAAIINTASVQAYEPSENLLDYSQTKAAIVAFTKSLAKQLAPKGIRVNAVAPGPVWTPLQVTGGQKPDTLKTFGAQTPLKRPGQPAELAAAYVTLASQESSFATGQVYGSSGGSGNP
jgi:NAD(P)-dependent dehydrogenase (short-subunit alcohol dehydrogenase family)